MVADNINLGGTAIKPVGWDRSIIYNFKMLLLFSNLGPRSHIFVIAVSGSNVYKFSSTFLVYMFYSYYFKIGMFDSQWHL